MRSSESPAARRLTRVRASLAERDLHGLLRLDLAVHLVGLAFQGLSGRLKDVKLLRDDALGGAPGHGFDAAQARPHAALGEDAEHADFARLVHVGAAAEFLAVGLVSGADAHDAHHVLVFFAKEGRHTAL